MTASIFEIFGGLALFLLAMEMMTDGLKSAAGHQLRHLLGTWTRTPLRGFAAGVLITGIVQSSSAVTVATIGFVNAGLLTLGHSLGVVFGANVGTTMTGWLVSLVGFGIKIEAFAMPLLALGMALRLIASEQRLKSIGQALAGFALFFLALSLLKESLEGLTGGLDDSVLPGSRYGLPVFILAGFLATVLTQSSSAALAIILSAAAGGLLPLESAAAAVIGANLGTTSTAAIAVMSATANARRLALGHVLFNLVTGAIAVIILPLMLWTVEAVTHWLELDTHAAISLALFHTLFNILGASIMLPLAPRFAHFLSRRFRSQEEDHAEPRFLDNTLVSTPELATGAVDQEMKRLIGHVRGLLRVCIDREGLRPAQVRATAEAARTLNQSINDYVSRVRAEQMHLSIVESLSLSIRTCRYLAEVTSLAPSLIQLRDSHRKPELESLSATFEHYLATLRSLFSDTPPSPDTFSEAEHCYHTLKNELLGMIVRTDISTSLGGQVLDDLSAVRRLSDQWFKSQQWHETGAL
ncbi:Na/Pi cotransporter family protein [Marinobacter salinexigens]|uniref:Na/Pi cotransporter family protein n=1 Tax=Marinobacter salinexigens TaxID=2919747 RepID=A0A5B0VA21_9GAMM|nr:Na/Pi symporter [Marinobacter salinexigens]KAA1171447.1 Na/Pi cotransporter family protein [Marinobacter salinexigens]